MVIIETLNERNEEAKDREAAENGESIEDRALALKLSYNGQILEDNTVTLADLDMNKDSMVELLKPDPQEGTGSFQFSNGAVYIGDWKLFGRDRYRHGEGTFTNGRCFQMFFFDTVHSR